MRNEPSADPGTLQPGVGSKLTSSSCSPITSKAEVWQRHKASNSAHIPLPLTLLQLLAFYTATTGQSTKILMKSYHCSNLQKSYCKFMSAEFTKGIVSLLSKSSTYQFETTFKDRQTVNNRTIKALKAEQSSDVQQTKDITKPICSTKQT
jgi:hypothetical protein